VEAQRSDTAFRVSEIAEHSLPEEANPGLRYRLGIGCSGLVSAIRLCDEDSGLSSHLGGALSLHVDIDDRHLVLAI
jgi:hypothetical protein